MSGFRVFLSAVSSEFARARDALANDLQHPSGLITACVQRSFSHDAMAGTLLHKLRNYISTCDAVVCLIGDRSGTGFPEPDEAAQFKDDLPPGVTEASYTQWEFYFAQKLNKTRLVYFAGSTFVRDKRKPYPKDRPDLQAAFVAFVRSTAPQYTPVTSRADFRAAVLRDLLHLRPAPSVSERLTALAAKVVLLPYPSLGSLFKGRDAFLRRLRESLVRDGSAAIAGKAVHGMGGVGKTRAAVEYAHAHRDQYTAIALLEADSQAKLDSALAGLTGALRLPESAGTDETVKTEAAIAWLNANPGWFLILDNVDEEPALAAAQKLLGRLSGGHVVLTSRLTRFPRGLDRLDLDVLTAEDATAFLLDATPARRQAADDATQARALADALGHLALALEIAAATIDAEEISFPAYQALWQGSRARVIGWAGQAITGYHHAVAETWRTSVDRLTEDGRTLLEHLAFLAPEPVPLSLLEVKREGAAEGEAALGALSDLRRYSLASQDAEAETFLVHRLVLDVTRRGLKEAGRDRARLTQALAWVNAALTGDAQDVRSWAVLGPLAVHAEAVAGFADAAGIVEPTIDVMTRLGTLFDAKALHQRSECQKRRALAIAEAAFPADDPRIAIRLNNLAELLRATNRLTEAEKLYRRALAIYEASYGPAHPDVATGLNNLAGLLYDTNRLAEAEPLFRRALSIDEASYGPAHPSVAIRLNNLAGLLRATNRLQEAEPLFRRALSIDKASYGPAHPSVAIRLNNLAGLLRATNRLAEAEPLYRRALEIDEASYGPAHPSVATGLNNLASLLYATNRLAEAEPLMRRALAIDEASYGPDHPDVAIDLSNLAELLRTTNRLAEAEKLSRRALSILLAFQRDTGHAHPHRDTVINNYASLLDAMGKTQAEIIASLQALLREVGLDGL